MWAELDVLGDDVAEQWRECVPVCTISWVVVLRRIGSCLPRQECDHEAKPGEEEHAAIDVDRVEDWDRASLPVYGIDLRVLEHCSEDPHSGWMLCGRR